MPDDKINDTLDTFWSEYNAFRYNNGPFDGYYFIWSSKSILKVNSNI